MGVTEMITIAFLLLSARGGCRQWARRGMAQAVTAGLQMCPCFKRSDAVTEQFRQEDAEVKQ
eukprot:11437820-Heterocapsa_arctica.AAC.1